MERNLISLKNKHLFIQNKTNKNTGDTFLSPRGNPNHVTERGIILINLIRKYEWKKKSKASCYVTLKSEGKKILFFLLFFQSL